MSNSRKRSVLKIKHKLRIKVYFLSPKYLVVIIFINCILQYCDVIMNWLPELEVIKYLVPRHHTLHSITETASEAAMHCDNELFNTGRSEIPGTKRYAHHTPPRSLSFPPRWPKPSSLPKSLNCITSSTLLLVSSSFPAHIQARTHILTSDVSWLDMSVSAAS